MQGVTQWWSIQECLLWSCTLFPRITNIFLGDTVQHTVSSKIICTNCDWYVSALKLLLYVYSLHCCSRENCHKHQQEESISCEMRSNTANMFTKNKVHSLNRFHVRSSIALFKIRKKFSNYEGNWWVIYRLLLCATHTLGVYYNYSNECSHAQQLCKLISKFTTVKFIKQRQFSIVCQAGKLGLEINSGSSIKITWPLHFSAWFFTPLKWRCHNY